MHVISDPRPSAVPIEINVEEAQDRQVPVNPILQQRGEAKESHRCHHKRKHQHSPRPEKVEEHPSREAAHPKERTDRTHRRHVRLAQIVPHLQRIAYNREGIGGRDDYRYPNANG